MFVFEYMGYHETQNFAEQKRETKLKEFNPITPMASAHIQVFHKDIDKILIAPKAKAI